MAGLRLSAVCKFRSLLLQGLILTHCFDIDRCAGYEPLAIGRRPYRYYDASGIKDTEPHRSLTDWYDPTLGDAAVKSKAVSL